ncbi:B-4DMT family transporter [Amycolatopsis sp. NBC_01480]|uniref:B-4DMT family transporter n=1 Tax=Amycolatopsis sp. NBC_01480 TaxID=2903562 RepID=UPI002E2C2E96|nr:B-4DMT family transporter [Amycolatopsis sp. NBC_01480]
MLGAWLTRGLVMAVVHAAAMTLLAKWSVFHPTDQTVITSVTLAVLVGVAALWSAIDGWRDRPDRGRAWFIAALVTGLAGGVLYVIGRAIFVDQTGVAELKSALTGGAAFSALLVLVPAGLGLFVGGRIRRPRRADSADDEVLEPDESRHQRNVGELDLGEAVPVSSSGSDTDSGSESDSGSDSADSPPSHRAKRRKPSPARRPRPGPDSDSGRSGDSGDLAAEDPAAGRKSGELDPPSPVSRPVAGRSRRRPTVAGRPPSPRSR